MTRFVLLVASPPADVDLRDDWRAFVLAHIFSSDDPVTPTYDLPAGTARQPDELPFVQETVELRAEAETQETS